jgi:hypothetical protein
MPQHTSSRDRIAQVGLVLLVGLIFGAVVAQMTYNIPNSDYQGHIQFTVTILQDHVFSRAHILFQLLLIGVSGLLPIGLSGAAILVAVVVYTITALILYRMIRAALAGTGWLPSLVSAGVALALLLVTPVTLLTLPEHNLYFGYVGINVLHNPTMVMLKPFALLLFAVTIHLLSHRLRVTARTVALVVLLILLSVIAKPNFVLVLLPTLLVVVAYRFYRRERADLKTVILLLIVPMIVVLALEYVFMYIFIDSQNGGGGGILFAPLLTIYVYDRQVALLPIKFLLSILFPLTVTLLYRQQAFKDLSLRLAWLIFVIGAAQMYLFAEGGDRLRDGNFWWSAQIGLFILFVASALFWLRHFRDQPGWRGRVCLIVFLLHVICGILFYALQFYSTGMSTWW